MLVQYATQLYTLRSLAPEARCRPVADAGFGGVELVGFDTAGLALEELDVAAVHVDDETIAADPAEAVRRARATGTETLVVPIVEERAFRWDAVDTTASRLDALATAVSEAGGRLLYHNHEFEFGATSDPTGQETGDDETPDDGETPFHRLVDTTTRLGFELDVGWATAAGVDPVALIERFGERIPIVHLKDVRVDATAERGGVPVDLGGGDVDLRGVLAAADREGVEWVVFEHDAPTEPARTVRDAAVWLGLESSGPR